MTRGNRQNVWFVFAEVAGFSGQLEATRLIYANLDPTRWSPRLFRMPSLNRAGGGILRFPAYALRLVAALFRSVAFLFLGGETVHVTLGQTAVAFLREGLPLVFASAFRSRSRVIVSLNGSNFMEWRRASCMARVFVLLLSRAAVVTVLGNRQRGKLTELGVPADRIQIVPNSCDVTAVSERDVERKHDLCVDVQVLFLSSLIDTKGYPEYLEALLRLSDGSGPNIHAILCGPVTDSQFCERFKSAGAASSWILDTANRINSTGRVRLEWVRGARDDAKWALFRRAQIFVFPSRYRVEAQPLVLVEAMAHGCAIVTSTVGEVRTILSESEARFLAKTDAETIAEQIEDLIADAGVRRCLGLAALTRFKSEFSLDRYVERWEGILSNLAARSHPSEHPNSR